MGAMRYLPLFAILLACAAPQVKLTDSEPMGEVEPSAEEILLMEQAYEENAAAQESERARLTIGGSAYIIGCEHILGGCPPSAKAKAAPPPPPAPAPTAPPPLAGASVASVILHTPSGDVEVKCPSVCPPGQACEQPEASGDPLKSAGTDLLKEVLTPLAAAIGGAIAAFVVGRKRKSKP